LHSSMKKRHKATAALVAVMALALAATYWLPGTVGAQTVPPDPQTTPPPSQSPVVTFRGITEDKWNELSPRPVGQYRGGNAGDDYGVSDLRPFEGGLEVGWTFAPADNIVGVKLERQMKVGDDHPPMGWTLLETYTEDALYYDQTGAPGFQYRYRITPYTAIHTVGTIHVTDFTEMIPRDGFFGYALADTTLKVRVVPTPDFETTDGIYSITMFDSRTDSDPYEYIGRKPSRELEGLVADKVYRFNVKIVEPGGAGYETVQEIGDFYIMTGLPPLPEAPSPIVGFGVGGKGIKLNWSRVFNQHRSQFAFFEIARRDAKNWNAPFEMLGTTTGQTFQEQRVTDSDVDHFEYVVSGVSWFHRHGPIPERGHVSPAIPHPTCANKDTGDSLPVKSLELAQGQPKAPRSNRFAFQPQPVALDPTAGTTGDNACGGFSPSDLSDYFVLRATLYQESLSGKCSDPDQSCVVVNRSPEDMDMDDFEPVIGSFQPVGASGSASIWYDRDLEPEKGLYRFAYHMCSYSEPRLCSENPFRSDWRFQGVTDLPFSR